MARVRVKQGQIWDRGNLGLFTAGMEAEVDSSILERGSGFLNIVEIVSLDPPTSPATKPKAPGKKKAEEVIAEEEELDDGNGSDEEEKVVVEKKVAEKDASSKKGRKSSNKLLK